MQHLRSTCTTLVQYLCNTCATSMQYFCNNYATLTSNVDSCKHRPKRFLYLLILPTHLLDINIIYSIHIFLRFKGFALIDGKPRVEVVYFMLNNQPELKIGFHFENQYLYKVVSMFYGDDKLKSTWMKFKSICKCLLLKYFFPAP